jgi:hypothetical protein
MGVPTFFGCLVLDAMLSGFCDEKTARPVNGKLVFTHRHLSHPPIGAYSKAPAPSSL